MKTLTLAALIAFTLLACGKSEKTPDPFGRTGNKQREPLTEREFTRVCSARNGKVYNGVCVATGSSKLYKSKADFDKLFEDGSGYKEISLGSAGAQVIVFGNVKGGQPVEITVDERVVVSLSEPSLARTLIGPGKIGFRVFNGTYEFLNIFTLDCFRAEDGGKEVNCPDKI